MINKFTKNVAKIDTFFKNLRLANFKINSSEKKEIGHFRKWKNVQKEKVGGKSLQKTCAKSCWSDLQ